MTDNKEPKSQRESEEPIESTESNEAKESPSVTPEPDTKTDSKDVQDETSGSEEISSQDKAASTSTSTSPAAEGSSASTTPPTQQTQWQAVWAPQYNAYYFYNSVTQETTWVNPLQPEASSAAASTSASSSAEGSSQQEEKEGEGEGSEAGPSTGSGTNTAFSSHYAALQAAALAQGIDPALAHLDPSLLAPAVPGSSFSAGGLPTFQAKFNNRTGQFTATNSRTPGHLSEYERAKRMSEFYFDVNQWEKQLAEQGGSINGEEAEGSKKRKRPTKKDLERFKEQKKAKKIAKTAWLRS
ncbi:hypothetical protein CVT24_009075 [Panaeolus cyanescens]|uniref:WW domain-containing protein n=1 Tax=Panaeolus cyanescens TaxID=181874 RepID=A0A409WEQ1_9AGAR|nr:hypothetical protein CVT24_009075 [Panaeolus cyanescens]